MAGRLSQAEREALARQDAQFLLLPLNPGPDPRSIAAHLRHTVGLLRNRQSPSPSAKAVAHLMDIYDRTIPGAARAQIACRKGCWHCCTQAVIVYPPEAFFIASRLRDRPRTVEAVRQAAATVRGREIASLEGTRLDCPMIEDGACSVYDARPLSCHSYVSIDLQDCINAFVQMEESKVRSPNVYERLRHACRLILIAALRLSGLSERPYEMNNALSAILREENAEQRWLAGEDIFAGIEPAGQLPPEVEAQLARMVAFVAHTI